MKDITVVSVATTVHSTTAYLFLGKLAAQLNCSLKVLPGLFIITMETVDQPSLGEGLFSC